MRIISSVSEYSLSESLKSGYVFCISLNDPSPFSSSDEYSDDSFPLSKSSLCCSNANLMP